MVSSRTFSEGRSSNLQDVKIYPNPIYEKSILSLNSATDLNYLIKIIDQMGRVVYQQKNRFIAGYQQLEVGKHWFPSSGLFRMVIEGEDFLITKKLAGSMKKNYINYPKFRQKWLNGFPAFSQDCYYYLLS